MQRVGSEDGLLHSPSRLETLRKHCNFSSKVCGSALAAADVAAFWLKITMLANLK